MKKTVGKRWLLCFLAVCSVFLIVAGINFKAQATDKERFILPKEIVKSVYVGTYANIARVMPSEENAENYHFGVINDTTGELVQTDGYRFVPEQMCIRDSDFGYELNGMTGLDIRTWGFGDLYIDWIAAVQVSAE